MGHIYIDSSFTLPCIVVTNALTELPASNETQASRSTTPRRRPDAEELLVACRVAPFQLKDTRTLGWSAGWMSPRAGLEAAVKRKISSLTQNRTSTLLTSNP
jgi:hypothetical protein